jgi:HEPN domain-containing protein
MRDKLSDDEKNSVIDYWIESAEEDLKTARSLFESSRYHHCLFFCHLFIEKILKSLVVKRTSRHSLPIHNLLKLAEEAEVDLSEKLREDLAIVNEFNIRARYNDYKREFYKKATPDYTKKWFERCREIYQWLNGKLDEK